MHVIIHTKPSCQPCKAVKRKFHELDIDYTEVELTDPEKFRAMGLLSAPVVEVDWGGGATWTWSGYAITQIETLDHALGCDDPVCDRCESVVA